MSIDAKKLRELIGNATKGEWRASLGYCGAKRKLFLCPPDSDGLLMQNEGDAHLLAYLATNAPSIADLADEVERLTGALEFYANVRLYNAVGGGQFIPILHYQVMRARTALAKPAKGGGE